MAKPEHAALLKDGVDKWNRWRSNYPETKPSLRGADLRRANLIGADLSKADLRRANLHGADIRAANLKCADLRWADLRWANLRGADVSSANVSRANLTRTGQGANLSGTDFRLVNAQFAKFDGANLTDCKLWETLRAGWSINGVICQRVFWDEHARDATEYIEGGFEKYHGVQQIIELFYKGGISRFELNTLPALIHHLEVLHPGVRLWPSIQITG